MRLARSLTPLSALCIFSLSAYGLFACAEAQQRDPSSFYDGAGSSSGEQSSGGAQSSGGTQSSGGAQSSGGTQSSGGGGGIDITPEAPQDDCSEAARLVYLLSDTDHLYSFNPESLQFTQIGQLNCPTRVNDATQGTNSMAVDRSGTAWVSYQSGELFRVSTSDASCTATDFPYLGNAFDKYGMGFSADGAGSRNETLFLATSRRGSYSGENGTGLYKVNPSTLQPIRVGDFVPGLEHGLAELTGGGDGTLYGFFIYPQIALATLNKTTGAPSDITQLSTVNLNPSQGYAFAFSYWGGDFWFYHSSGNAMSKVSRLRRATDNREEVVVQNAGFRIVGAGVSTCAPTTPVN